MNWEIITEAVIISGVTAISTGFVNSKIMNAHLEDLKERIVRIETYLNGLLKKNPD